MLSHIRPSTATRARCSTPTTTRSAYADALRRSPHFRAADADPGGDTVWLTTEAGINYTLTFKDPEPTDDDLLPEPVLTEAIAAAILNHPGFVTADADSPREDTTPSSPTTRCATSWSWSWTSTAATPSPRKTCPPRPSTSPSPPTSCSLALERL
ncbi:hypothetical protein [Streptomyces gardneri]|uniref:hypothetical protein n=1 Tax=Streptomyces gardneri TaxID=66892 RepID=UPI0037D5FB73